MAGKDDWVVTIKDELQRMDTIRTEEKQHWDKRSIYRVPASGFTDLKRKAYKPQFVSFGPYHHGEDHLKPMEEHKHRALLHFLKRSSKPLESYLNTLAEVAQSLKDSYESLDLVWERDTDRFLRMMILDGCFMLEVLRNNTQTADKKDTLTVNDYVANDPIFSDHGKLYIVPYIRRDMLMLENQLPMLLLTTLLDEETKQDEEYLNKLILQFCCGNTRFAAYPSMGKCLHLLDLHRKILLWPDTRNLTSRQGKSWWRWNPSSRMAHEAGAGDEIIRSAMELNEAGISFNKSKSRSLKDITFEAGMLRLPSIVVDDTTESMFLNLIAFERFHVGVGNEVTSYLLFMDSLMHSAKDVSLLHDRCIIQNAIGNDKAVAELFNSFSKDVTLDPRASSLVLVHNKVDRYCNQRWNKWRLNLYLSYFAFLAKRPWWRFSVGLALLLLVLTLLQAVYTMLSYYLPK